MEHPPRRAPSVQAEVAVHGHTWPSAAVCVCVCVPAGLTLQTGSSGMRTPTDLRCMVLPFRKSTHWLGRFLLAPRTIVYCGG